MGEKTIPQKQTNERINMQYLIFFTEMSIVWFLTVQVIAGNTLSSLNALFQKHLSASEPQSINVQPDFFSHIQASDPQPRNVQPDFLFHICTGKRASSHEGTAVLTLSQLEPQPMNVPMDLTFYQHANRTQQNWL